MFSSYQNSCVQSHQELYVQSNQYSCVGQTVSYVQPSSIILEPELLIGDNNKPGYYYPFNLDTTGISNIEMKLDNTNINIDSKKIISNNPIFIQCVGSTLQIWNTKSSPNNKMSTKGNTYVDGFNIIDFNNNNITSAITYDHKNWHMPKLNTIDSLNINGNSNIINISTELSKSVIMNILGQNNVYINNGMNISNLEINIIHSKINFDDIHCDNLKLRINGIGDIKGLTINESSDINIVGSSIIYLKRSTEINSQQTINGIGRIIWI